MRAATAALGLVVAVASQAEDRSVWEGIYTDAQAEAGQVAYVRSCIACHADQPGVVTGEAPAPGLIGEDFAFRWSYASLADLYDTIRQTMPQAAPNSLSEEDYAAISAYVLKINGYPAGDAAIDPNAYDDMFSVIIDDAPEE